ncbi:UvrD-helicase domain-containing protein [Nocardioides sambongensis]|uniref:UvrD-helicase domain-containing protein n=1 Tax=Nocardioides sambongensis TaxID=2589074 RepID=UPI001125E852|nr:UvrD-helicase domain-containing protein [Nocardioides sambongensis]
MRRGEGQRGGRPERVSPHLSDGSASLQVIGGLQSCRQVEGRRWGVIGGRQANSWSPSFWARHLGRAPYWTIGVVDQHISVMTPTGLSTVHVAEHQKLTFETGSIWARMSAPELGIHTPLPGLSKRALSEYQLCVASQVKEYEEALDLQPVLDALLGWWTGYHAAAGESWASRHWLPEEFIVEWESQLARVRARYPLSAAQRRLLEGRADLAQRPALQTLDGAWSVRAQVAAQNDALVDVELIDERAFFDRIEKTPLTEEQARAVICFDNRVQLIASAGSGKTSTMVAKAGWTIRKGLANADEILLLAFNKSAGAELGDRCEQRLANANISTDGLRATTFHAFGLKVIGEATGAKPRLAAGLDTDNGVPLLADVVRALRRSSAEFAASWSLFQNVLGVPMTGDAEPEPDAWDPQKRRSGYRDLNLEVMKSAGERAIANWLIKSGVEFDYERPYEVNVADAQHSQYRPDFFYPAAGVYHEHWALVSGQPEPPGFEGYLQSSAWKKGLHAANGTVLIETAARDLANGSLFESLERQLRASGIEPDFDPDRAVPGTPLLTDREMCSLFRTFLAHAKSNRLGDSDLRARVAKGRNGAPDLRETLFLNLFDEVRREWDRRLQEANEVDFEDMLNRATDLVEAGRWTSPYRVVLVDEFQDASHSRARLVQALVSRPGHFLFAVGDDWQSIYRFAGSDISAMTRFEATFGRGHVLRLERTFRNSQQLSTLAGDFVMKNPSQLKKRVRSEQSLTAPLTLALVDSDAGVTSAIDERLRELAAVAADGSPKTVKVLGRYRYEQELLPRTRYPGIDVSFQTVHSSKGLEADHVIIPGLSRGAFPSIKEDDPLLRLALPEGDEFPHAEERRLFYVALTRARETVLLIARNGRESEFVTELLGDGVVTLLRDVPSGQAPDPCPVCGKGLMVLRQGKYGPFLACNRFPACTSKRRIAS